MIVAIMQPYFFPYIGYFQLIRYADRFIAFDTPKFIRHGWIERNRIMSPKNVTLYIKVPLEKHSSDTPIKEIRINNAEAWQDKLLAQLGHYKKKAPFFGAVVRCMEEVFAYSGDSITDLNVHALAVVCRYLGLDFDYEVFSRMEIELPEVQAPDEWALNIAGAIGAIEYVNPPGGVDFFDPEKYIRKGIKLTFLRPRLREYSQFPPGFISGLSIVDVMMFNPPEIIAEMLDDYTLIHS